MVRHIIPRTSFLLYPLAMLFPPLAVACLEGCSEIVLINVGLLVLGWFPGFIHACHRISKATIHKDACDLESQPAMAPAMGYQWIQVPIAAIGSAQAQTRPTVPPRAFVHESSVPLVRRNSSEASLYDSAIMGSTPRSPLQGSAQAPPYSPLELRPFKGDKKDSYSV